MAICPTCNHDAAFGARFCSLCGTALPRRVCGSCGTANEVEAFRCVECGEALRQAAPVPAPVDEVATPRELGPMARLAELTARSAPAAAPSATVTAANPVVASQAPPSMAGRAASTAPMQAEPPAPSLPPPGGQDEAEAVDLYLELPRSSPVPVESPALRPTQRQTASAPSTPNPLAAAEGSPPVPDMPAVDLMLPAPHRLARFAPYAIGLAAVGVGVFISGDAWLWPRSSQVREAPSPAARPAVDRPAARPAQPAPPAVDEARRPGQPPSPPTTTPTARTTPPSERASAAAPRRGDGVDAAADAALAAAERALAAQARQVPTQTTARPAAQARPGASSAGPSAPPGNRSGEERRQAPANGGPATAP